MLVAVAFFSVACGEGAIEQERSERGHSQASSSKDEDQDLEQGEDGEDSETAQPPAKKDPDTKHVSTSSGDQESTSAGTRDKPVDASGASSTEPPAEDKSAFDPGAGTLLADGKTVKYRIPDGTGGKDWNPANKPINVAPGMTLRLADDDSTVAAKGGHWLHTYGQPCPHGTRAIGQRFDCKIRDDAPAGLVQGTFEHNIQAAGGAGRLYIMVVRKDATGGAPSTR
ncbi:MAG TPA: hypothetical protein VI299_18110 [Polyangiales bacterium]